MPLITTPGAMDANSYVDVASSGDLIVPYPQHVSWCNESVLEREQCLRLATLLLDQHITWRGDIVSESQSLGWPRHGVFTRNGVELSSLTIPSWLALATSLLGSILCAEQAQSANGSTLGGLSGVKRFRSGRTEIEWDSTAAGSALTVIPPQVAIIAQPYGYAQALGQLQIVRV